VALDGAGDPGGLRPSLCLAEVVSLARQPHQQHGHEACAKAKTHEQHP
jgi:hypothetical protein